MSQFSLINLAEMSVFCVALLTCFAAKKFCGRNSFEIYSINKNSRSISRDRIIKKAYSCLPISSGQFVKFVLMLK